MTQPSRVFVGAGQFTAGSRSGIFRRIGDGGWEALTTGLPADLQVMAITVDARNPDVVYIGTSDGPYRSRDGGDRWERLDVPERGLQVWSILIHPDDPRRLYAGTSPVGVLRSDDGGDTWRRLPGAVQPELGRRRVVAGDPGRDAAPPGDGLQHVVAREAAHGGVDALPHQPVDEAEGGPPTRVR